jgi:predicted transcriptional regulator
MSDELLVRGIMTEEIKSVYYYETIKSAAKNEKDNPVGAVTRKDVSCRVVRNAKPPQNVLVSSITSSTVATVNENVSVREFAKILGEMEYNHLLIEKNGKLAGIAGSSDIINAVAGDKI